MSPTVRKRTAVEINVVQQNPVIRIRIRIRQISDNQRSQKTPFKNVEKHTYNTNMVIKYIPIKS